MLIDKSCALQIHSSPATTVPGSRSDPSSFCPDSTSGLRLRRTHLCPNLIWVSRQFGPKFVRNPNQPRLRLSGVLSQRERCKRHIPSSHDPGPSILMFWRCTEGGNQFDCPRQISSADDFAHAITGQVPFNPNTSLRVEPVDTKWLTTRTATKSNYIT